MKSRTLVLAGAACLLKAPVLAVDMPYTGQQARPIKALSDAEIAALRKGEGMGMAKAAELNGYPGPVHASRRRTSTIGARVGRKTALPFA